MGFFSNLADLGRDIGSEFSNLGKELKKIGKDTIEEIKNDPAKYALESAKDIAVISGKAAKFAVTEVLPSMAENLAKSTASMADKRLQNNDLSPEERAKFEGISERSKERAKKFEDFNLERTINNGSKDLARADIGEEEK